MAIDMSETSLQARRVMSQIIGTAPDNVYAVRHKKKGLWATDVYGRPWGTAPGTWTNISRARARATIMGYPKDHPDVEIVELEVAEVKVHTRSKEKGGI